MSKFLPTSGFKWINPKRFDLDNYTSNSSKACVLEVDLEYPKEPQGLHNDYPLTPDQKRNAVRISAKDCRFTQYSYW